jgi:hypothetical protein
VQLREANSQILAIEAHSIEEFHRSIDWSAPNVNEQVNQLLQKTALQRLLTYGREGNQALGVYNDKHDPTEVPQQFAYMLSYTRLFQSACRISTNTFSTIPMRSPQTSTTRSIGRG